MPFGATFQQVWAAASDGAKAAAQALVSGATAAGAATAAAASATQKVVTAGAAAAGRGVVKATHAAADGAAAGARAVGGAAKAAGTAVAKPVAAAYDGIKSLFTRKLVGQPIGKCGDDAPSGDPGADLVAKKTRLAERKRVIADGRKRAAASDDPDRTTLTRAADDYERNINAVERARLSRHVYGNGDPLPPGWQAASQNPDLAKRLGFEPAELDGLLKPTDSDFRAEIYESTIDGSVVVAYKGTTFTSGSDWKSNVKQGVGMEADHYNRANDLGMELADRGVNFETTGHSLGGGMASAVSVAQGAQGTTFNAAGLHQKTLDRVGRASAQVEAYQVEGEVLTGLQSTLPGMAEAYGQPRKLPAVDGEGYRRPINDINPVNKVERHFMNNAINGLEKQKADDAHILQSSGPVPAARVTLP